MKKLALLFFIFHFSFFTFYLSEAQVINVPADFHTIQEGIDASTDGDTVLVAPGNYPENIYFNGKKITVASWFLTTQDEAFISQTIIDGQAAGSVLVFSSGEDSTAMLSGFTLTNGISWSGAGIYCYNASPVLAHLIITNNTATNYGGGIYCDYANPHLQNVTIKNNSAGDYGGGMFFSGSDPVFDSINRCNIYFNTASTGNDLYGYSYMEKIKVVLDTFSVLYPTDMFASPFESFSFDILNGKFEQVSADLFVSPDGDNANSGLTADDPLKTISYAMLIILADSLDQHTVHLSDGTYSPSGTGEMFPVRIPEYVSLAGASKYGSILDAEGTSTVIEINNRQFVEVSDMTITGGNGPNAGGIYCYGSPVLQNLFITGNTSQYSGGGIYSSGNPKFNNVTITYNSSDVGGGLYIECATGPELVNVTIAYNSAITSGGGICYPNSGWWSCPPSTIVFDTINRCNIYLNNAPEGDDLYSGAFMAVIVDTFTVALPKSIHASPLKNFSFDILHGLLPQENLELFVSPSGDNANSGQTADDPLKTIQFTLSVIKEDSLNFYKLHLLNGTYSTSSNGESFPLVIPEFVQMDGESESGVILDAEGQARVIDIVSSPNVSIAELTVTGGADGNYWGSGGGIFCSQSNPILKNITVSNNTAYSGGGIYCSYSSPYLENVTLKNNSADYSGGGIYFVYSSPVFDSINRCNIYLNSAGYGDDLYAESFTNIVVDTFTVLIPKSIHANPIQNFSFDILHGLLPQENIDLFLSPGGDDTNSGLTPDDPLKTVQHTFSLINQDSLNFYTLHLLNGTYSQSATGEVFPLNIPEFVKIEGESESVTILDAEGLSGVITINNSQNVKVSYLTITGGKIDYDYGYGGGIYCYSSSPELRNLSITGNSAYYGGGIYCEYNCNPHVLNTTISNNTAFYGGGIYASNSSNPDLENIILTHNSAQSYGGGLYTSYSNPQLENVSITNNIAEQSGGGIYFTYNSYPEFDSINRSNIYFNSASDGNDLYTEGIMVNPVVLDTFSVLTPTRFHADPLDYFDFDILNGKIAQAEADLYVSPDGDNANSGLTAADPLKNIFCAYSKMMADSLHPHTVILLPGTYSPSATGEIFPIIVYDYMSLSGVSEKDVILDAGGLSGVMTINDRQFVGISDMTITGGNGNNGGGIYCYGSPVLQNLYITGNNAQYSGGGIFSNGNPKLKNVTLTYNSSDIGGGIFIECGTGPELENVTVAYNSAFTSGGGIYYPNSSWSFCPPSPIVFDTTNRSNIYLNNAPVGNDLYSGSFMDVIVDTFTIITPKPYYAYPLENFSFDIMHGKVSTINADVYVSPDGDNTNTGLTADSPLKTIQFAAAIMATDSQNPNTIHLLNGTYSHSTNREHFPLVIPPNIRIEGESEDGVIIDAEGKASVFEFYDNQATGLSDLTISGGSANVSGGGIYSKNSSPDLVNVSISHNVAAKNGGGIYLDNSNPEMFHVTISGNTSKLNGGGAYFLESSPALHDVLVIDDSAGYAGGGIYCAVCPATVLDSVTIANNHAGNSGGGIYCNNSDVILSDVVISDNSSTERGGGMCLNNSDPFIGHVSIINNSSETGGGIYCASSALRLVNLAIAGNSALTNGGAIYSASSQLSFINVTVAGNNADNGGGIYCYNTELGILNSIFRNDSPSEIFFKATYDESTVSVAYSDLKGGESGILTNNNGTLNWLDGNIDGDPLYTGAGDHPYALSGASPCRDAGIPDTTGLFLPLNDFASNPRIWNDRIDMGAYEWNNVGVDESPVVSHQSAVVSYPNPTRGIVDFRFSVADAGRVTLKVYDIQGREVSVVSDENFPAGEHTVKWDASMLPPGVYTYRTSTIDNLQSAIGKLVKY